jgi:asparagine synthase (glutamine-hydrolysing)
MAKHLPAVILTRGKQGFGLPVRDWFRGTLKNYATDLLLAPDSRCSTFLNRQAVSKIIDLHQQGHRDLSERIWTLIMLEHWLRAYKI